MKVIIPSDSGHLDQQSRTVLKVESCSNVMVLLHLLQHFEISRCWNMVTVNIFDDYYQIFLMEWKNS